MRIDTVPTHRIAIYVGLKHRSTGVVYPIDEARRVIQKYVNEVGLCVTLTPTEFIYTEGSEPGFAVGLINYPRFPSKPTTLLAHAEKLAALLQDDLRQLRVSIVADDVTVMLSSEEASKEVQKGNV